MLLSATDTVFPGWQYQWQYNFGSGWSTMVGDTFPLISVDTAYAPFGGDDTVYFRLRVEYENQFGNTICPNITDSVAVIFFNPPNLRLPRGYRYPL
ncbi:MAG: hypothetical protein U5L96_11615 [Owenweeksia sp.]|nr:hypothetical protein [Owenweeksia sp.]